MKNLTVFISYSHKDEEWKNRLVTHLGVLKREEILDAWDDQRIMVGDNWQSEIVKAINNASVAILLISANFLTSKFILDEEVPKLLVRRKEENVCVIPLIVKPCAWKQVKWLASIQAWPKDGSPLSSGNEDEIDKNLAALANEIAAIIRPREQPHPLVPPNRPSTQPNTPITALSPEQFPRDVDTSTSPRGFSLRVWYEKLPNGQKAIVIGVTVVIVILMGFIVLTGVFGSPEVSKIINAWPTRSTPTLTATQTPSPTPTIEIEIPPNCQDVEILYFELDLATGLGQKIYPDAHNVITLAYNDISNFSGLSGRAILNTNVSGCSWKWEGGTEMNPSTPSWKSIDKTNFSFYVKIPDQSTGQAMTIYLKLTNDEQLELYTIDVLAPTPAP